jgi:hypothetical protein
MTDAARGPALIVADRAEIAATFAASLAADASAVVQVVSPPVAGPGDLDAAAAAADTFWQTTVANFVATHGALALAVHILPALSTNAIDGLSLETFRTLEVRHIIHPWLGLKRCIAAMTPAGGAIVIVARRPAQPEHDLFAATAANALRVMVRAVAQECGGLTPPIRINIVEADAEVQDMSTLVAAAGFLGSSRSSFMTGAEIVVSRPAAKGR